MRSTDGRCRPNPRKGLAEADVLVRLRLKEAGLGVSHLVMAVTPDGEVVLRSNVSSGPLRSFGEDLKNIADEKRRRNRATRRINRSARQSRAIQSF